MANGRTPSSNREPNGDPLRKLTRRNADAMRASKSGRGEACSPSTVTSSFLLCAMSGLTRVGIAPYGHCPNPVRELLMSDKKPDISDRSRQRKSALSKWEDEGGAGPHPSRRVLISNKGKPRDPQLAMAELVQLRIRVIALENLVIGLLAEASDRQLALAREMAIYISPRPNFTGSSVDDSCGSPDDPFCRTSRSFPEHAVGRELSQYVDFAGACGRRRDTCNQMKQSGRDSPVGNFETGHRAQ